MKIYVIGTPSDFDECRQRFEQRHHVEHLPHYEKVNELLDPDVVFFDYLAVDNPLGVQVYNAGHRVFIDSSRMSLGQLRMQCKNSLQATIFGFNGMPGFLQHHLLEVSAMKSTERANLEALCQQLETPYAVVDDRIGMVTPRIICMIINEAYYTVQEGTASREDIDMAMKLGTNYPFGPFEWCARIGVGEVYQLLDALYEDTRDERYKICPLLKKEYLHQT